MTHISPVQQRLRITFGKEGNLKFTSSLDIAKVWERVLRRANLPVLYTQGFNTRPRLQLAMPLPLGITSECEILDVALREEIEFEESDLIEELLAVSPKGLTIQQIEAVDIQSSAMQRLIISAEYRIRFEDGIDRALLQQRIDELLAQEKIIIEKIQKRKRSVMDLRPLIVNLHINEDNAMIAHLSVGERGNLRPDELLKQMGFEDEYISIHRYMLHSLDA